MLLFISMITGATLFDASLDLGFGQKAGLVFFSFLGPFIVYFVLRVLVNKHKSREKWRTATVSLSSMPCFMGEQCNGEWQIPNNENNNSPIIMQLGCYRQQYSRAQNRHSTHKDDVLWESKSQKIAPGSYDSHVKFSFELPENRPQSSWNKGPDSAKWLLKIKIKEEEFLFELPVFNR